MRWILGWALSLSLLFAPALAAAAPTFAAAGAVGSYTTPAGGSNLATVVQEIGLENGNGAACLVGSDATCQLPGSSTGGGGLSVQDQATFTPGTSNFTPGGCEFQTTATSNPLTNGKQGAFGCTAQRALFANLRDSSGNELGVAAAPLQVSLANTAANGTPLAFNLSQVGGAALVFGQATMANSLPVAIASNQGSLPVSLGAPAGSTYQAGNCSNSANTACTMVASPGVGHSLFGQTIACGNSNTTGTYITLNDSHSLQLFIPPTYGNNWSLPLGATIQWASNTAATFTPGTNGIAVVSCNLVGYSV